MGTTHTLTNQQQQYYEKYVDYIYDNIPQHKVPIDEWYKIIKGIYFKFIGNANTKDRCTALDEAILQIYSIFIQCNIYTKDDDTKKIYKLIKDIHKAIECQKIIAYNRIDKNKRVVKIDVKTNETVAVYPSRKEALFDNDITKGALSNCILGRRKQLKGYIYKEM